MQRARATRWGLGERLRRLAAKVKCAARRVGLTPLTAGLRESDLAARWGGEEFVVLTAASDQEDATLADPSDTIETLVERADQAMYMSKSNGRDQLTYMAL